MQSDTLFTHSTWWKMRMLTVIQDTTMLWHRFTVTVGRGAYTEHPWEMQSDTSVTHNRHYPHSVRPKSLLCPDLKAEVGCLVFLRPKAHGTYCTTLSKTTSSPLVARVVDNTML